METIKSYTDIEQSKKLADILPLESVDAFYIIGKEPVDITVIYGFVTHKHLKEQIAYKRAVPCWSLTALLNILPNYQLQTQDDGIGIICSYNGKFNIVTADNSVDACYKLILKLHELNLL